jgi:hypothetical protein
MTQLVKFKSENAICDIAVTARNGSKLIESDQSIKDKIFKAVGEYKKNIETARGISEAVKENLNIVQLLIGNMGYCDVNLNRAEDTINRQAWGNVFVVSGLLEWMPAKERKSWDDWYSSEKNIPLCTEKNVLMKLQHLFSVRKHNVVEMVDGIFKILSPTHKTNSKFGFNERIIIKSALNEYGSLKYYYKETLRDFEKLIHIIQSVSYTHLRAHETM